MAIKIIPPREEIKFIRGKFNYAQTCEYFGIGHTTLVRWCKKYNLTEEECKGIPKVKKPSREELKALRKTMTNKGVADFIGVYEGTIEKWSSGYNLEYHECKYDVPLILPNELSEIQHDVIIGNLLGDGTLAACLGMRNSNFRINQEIKKKEYVEYLQKIYAPFSVNDLYEGKSKKPRRIDGKISHEFWDGGFCYYAKMETHCHPIFTKLREKWYPNGVKIVPKDLILNWQILAIWFCDDGCNQAKNRHAFISTNNFTMDDVGFLVKKLYDDLGVETSIQLKDGNPIIYIPAKSFINFMTNITPHITYNCMKYKCDLSEYIVPIMLNSIMKIYWKLENGLMKDCLIVK
jgi:hypothetical protein